MFQRVWIIKNQKNRIPICDKYITTPKLNKLKAENFTARLKQANLVTKIDFDKKLTSFKKFLKFTSTKRKYLEVQKKLSSLIKKKIFVLSRIFFISNDGSENTFVYQPTLDTLKLKKTKVLITFLVGNQMEYIILTWWDYILLSYIA